MPARGRPARHQRRPRAPEAAPATHLAFGQISPGPAVLSRGGDPPEPPAPLVVTASRRRGSWRLPRSPCRHRLSPARELAAAPLPLSSPPLAGAGAGGCPAPLVVTASRRRGSWRLPRSPCRHRLSPARELAAAPGRLAL